MSAKQARISDYWMSDLEEKDRDFVEDSSESSSSEKTGNKRKEIEKENKNPRKKKAGVKKDGDFIENSSDTSSSEETGNKRKGKENKNSKKKKAGGKIDGLTPFQHKRMLGDQVKSKLEIAGGKYDWHIKARCHLTTSLSREAFKAVVVPHVGSVTPAKFDNDTEVLKHDEGHF